MEYWKIEELKSLTRDFIKALQKKTPDFDRAKDLLNRGVSINATDSFGDSVLCECLLNLSCFPPECDFCEIETCKTCENNGKAQLIPILITDGIP